MRINGRNRLACKTLIKDVNPDKEITVEPIKGLPVLKDLVVDMEPFFEAYRVGDAVPGHLRERADPGADPVPGGPGAVRRHHQVHPLCGLYDVLPGVLVRRPVLRPAGDRRARTGSSSTAATRAPSSAWRSSTRRKVSGAAAPPSTAPRPAPAASRSPRPSKKSNEPSSSAASKPTQSPPLHRRVITHSCLLQTRSTAAGCGTLDRMDVAEVSRIALAGGPTGGGRPDRDRRRDPGRLGPAAFGRLARTTLLLPGGRALTGVQERRMSDDTPVRRGRYEWGSAELVGLAG